MGRFRWLAGLLLFLLLLNRPQAAVDGAQRAMAQWAHSVAPSLFPFMALMPLLTGEDAARAYQALFGRVMRGLFNLPGSAAPAFVMGMVAGSPAGAVAARRVAAGGGMNRGELRRVACCACGMSPAFMISGIGAGMLGDAGLGHILLRSQIVAQLLTALLLRGAWREDRAPVPPETATGENAPVRAAVLAILTVCGYMTFFGALAGVTREIAGRRAGDGLVCILDVPAGALVIAGLGLGMGEKMILLSILTGFGGVCIGLQNLAALRGCCVTAGEYFSIRGIAVLLSGLMTALQLRIVPSEVVKFSAKPFEIAALCGVILAIPVLKQMKKSIS